MRDQLRLQYNYSHDNSGPNTIRYDISEHDALLGTTATASISVSGGPNAMSSQHNRRLPCGLGRGPASARRRPEARVTRNLDVGKRDFFGNPISGSVGAF